VSIVIQLAPSSPDHTAPEGPTATTDGRSTSVGSLAIQRFLRPVCYQDFPAMLLPDVLRDGGVTAIPRRIDGKLVLQTGATQ